MQAFSGIDVSHRDVEVVAKLTKGVREGMTEIAQALAETEKEWIEHGLGDATEIEAVAEQAAGKHGREAIAMLKQQANKLFAAGSCADVPVKKRHKVEDAIVKWRAALWLHLDKRSEGSVYEAWSIIDTRHRFWEKVISMSPFCMHMPCGHQATRLGHVRLCRRRLSLEGT